jgi:ABC-type multidrug transport system ATPase subunit
MIQHSAAILTEGLSKQYGATSALRGLDLAVENGTVFAPLAVTLYRRTSAR